MKVGDRVEINDTFGRHLGTVLMTSPPGMCLVGWDSGVTERIHRTELAYARDGVGCEDEGLAQEALREMGAYEIADPKHPRHHDLMADLADLR